jgi:hypothetical protein
MDDHAADHLDHRGARCRADGDQGTIPAPLQTIIDGIADARERFAAEMLISGATTFERSHPLTAVVGASIGWTSTQIDEFFIFAASL